MLLHTTSDEANQTSKAQRCGYFVLTMAFIAQRKPTS